MRGSRTAGEPGILDRGPIPAHAGEPLLRTEAAWTSRAYPRACGGAAGDHRCTTATVGLSPRMRGSLTAYARQTTGIGPIPAHAGEPRFRSCRRSSRRAYPRACGGASCSCSGSALGSGLSPRMRGSLHHGGRVGDERGPIPAHAGEPACLVKMPCEAWAYPRACGGAGRMSTTERRLKGLSPRMRGSPHGSGFRLILKGPIPAHAGEPTLRRKYSSPARAYPRACGGAADHPQSGSSARGLSPRMRGSRSSLTARASSPGPIPAHAGEPCLPPWPLRHCAAYPRACGGAYDLLRDRILSVGLSPRMRGSLPPFLPSRA